MNFQDQIYFLNQKNPSKSPNNGKSLLLSKNPNFISKHQPILKTNVERNPDHPMESPPPPQILVEPPKEPYNFNNIFNKLMQSAKNDNQHGEPSTSINNLTPTFLQDQLLENSNITVLSDDSNSPIKLINKRHPSPQLADNCIKVENNIFLISTNNCQIFDQDDEQSDRIRNESESSRESSRQSHPPPSCTPELIMRKDEMQLSAASNLNENSSNLACFFESFAVPQEIIHNFDQRPVGFMSRTISNLQGTSESASFLINKSNEINRMNYQNHIPPIQQLQQNHPIHNQQAQRQIQYVIHPESKPKQIVNSEAPVAKKRKVGRPKANLKKKLLEEAEAKKALAEKEAFLAQTRCGRKVKVPTTFFQADPTNIAHSSIQRLPEVHQEIVRKQETPDEPKLLCLENVAPPKRPRKISSKFRCGTCKKIYLGKNKMANHFKLNPDHKPPNDSESILYSHLMTLVHQRSSNETKASFFLKELSNFVEEVHKLVPKLITNQEENSLLRNIDKHMASLLRINPGSYRLNMNVFDKNFKNEPKVEVVELHDIKTDEMDDFQDDREKDEFQEDEIDRMQENGAATVKMLNEQMQDIPSLDCTEVNNLLIRNTQHELTNLTNISDIVGESPIVTSPDILKPPIEVLSTSSTILPYNENAICEFRDSRAENPNGSIELISSEMYH